MCALFLGILLFLVVIVSGESVISVGHDDQKGEGEQVEGNRGVEYQFEVDPVFGTLVHYELLFIVLL